MPLAPAWMVLARRLDVTVIAEDPALFAVLMLGAVPPLLLMFWANLRAFGHVVAPVVVEDDPFWRTLAGILGGMVAVVALGEAIVTLSDMDARAGELVLAYFVGLALSGPAAAHYLWTTRAWWRNPGSFWGPTEKERREALEKRAEEGRRKADAHRTEARAAAEAAKRERQDRRQRLVGRRDDG